MKEETIHFIICMISPFLIAYGITTNQPVVIVFTTLGLIFSLLNLYLTLRTSEDEK